MKKIRLRLGRYIRRKILEWLLKDGIPYLRVGGNTVDISPNDITLPSLTSDPSLAKGKLWFRGDLGQLRFSPDGSNVKQVYPAHWNDIQGKPSTYPPSAHTHSRSEITDFWSTPFWDNIPDKPSKFPPESHTHSRSEITDFWSSPFWDNIPDKPSTFPPSAHDHAGDTLRPASVVFQGLTADPSLEAGKVWYRSDLDEWRYSPDGTNVKVFGKSIFQANIDEVVKWVANNPDNYYLAKILSSLSPKLTISILEHSAISADKAQAILYAWVDQLCDLGPLIELMTEGAPDEILSAHTTYTGKNRFGTLNLNGYIYFADGQPHVIIARSIIVPSESAIQKTETGGEGGAPGAGVGRGGYGGGGLIIIAKEMTVIGTVKADGGSGQSGSTTGSYAGGKEGSGGYMLVASGDSPGNGGNGGARSSGNEAPGGSPGGGGGGGYTSTYGPGGAGGVVSLATVSSRLDILKEVMKAAVDWWLMNVLGKTPTSIKYFPSCYGAGGGGGGDYNTFTDSGGGGGSGGWIALIVDRLDLEGTISAKGGDGGNGGNDGNYDAGGGGGGGGIIYVFYRLAMRLGTLDVSGGKGGTSDAGCAVKAGDGTPGTAALVRI